MEDLRSLAEAAEELGIAPVTLRAAVSRGRFAARKFGQTYVTTRAEIDRYRRENLGQVGRPPVPRIFRALEWPLGAYTTKSLVLSELVDVGDEVRDIAIAIAEQAIAEGAWQLEEVVSKLLIDARLRSIIVARDESIPQIFLKLATPIPGHSTPWSQVKAERQARKTG